MAKKKKIINQEDLYVGKISDEKIMDFIKSELKRKHDLLVQVYEFDHSGAFEYLPGVNYFKFNRIERKNEFVLVELKMSYIEPNNNSFSGLRGRFGTPVYQISDYDCVLANQRFPKETINEEWVKFVAEESNDPNYIQKAKKYAKETFDQDEFKLLDEKSEDLVSV